MQINSKMPHQYGLPGFVQTPPSPSSQSGSLANRMHSGGGQIVPSNHSNIPIRLLERTIEDKRLTREAMERYMRERSDMVIVILHAKVKLIQYPQGSSFINPALCVNL